MLLALDDVCKALNFTDGKKAELAERIIALAQRGERTPTRLRDRVLQESGFGNVANGPRRWAGL